MSYLLKYRDTWGVLFVEIQGYLGCLICRDTGIPSVSYLLKYRDTWGVLFVEIQGYLVCLIC